jgi:hypothetical protein
MQTYKHARGQDGKQASKQAEWDQRVKRICFDWFVCVCKCVIVCVRVREVGWGSGCVGVRVCVFSCLRWAAKQAGKQACRQAIRAGMQVWRRGAGEMLGRGGTGREKKEGGRDSHAQLSAFCLARLTERSA